MQTYLATGRDTIVIGRDSFLLVPKRRGGKGDTPSVLVVPIGAFLTFLVVFAALEYFLIFRINKPRAFICRAYF